MAVVAVYDACVLHPAPLRDLLLRLAAAGLVQARWTDAILDEVFRSIRLRRPDLAPHALERTRSLMNQAVRDCLVIGYERWIEMLELPDPDDRHVLAAAIRARAELIVTSNTRDFPTARLAPHGIRAIRPDACVLGCLDRSPAAVVDVVRRQAAALRRPPRTASELMDTLQAQGLDRSVRRLRTLVDTRGK